MIGRIDNISANAPDYPQRESGPNSASSSMASFVWLLVFVLISLPTQFILGAGTETQTLTNVCSTGARVPLSNICKPAQARVISKQSLDPESPRILIAQDAQTLTDLKELPKPPSEALEPLPDTPKLPKTPSVPGIEGAKEKLNPLKESGKSGETQKNRGATRQVLGHRKRFVLYPRLGYMQVAPRAELEGIGQTSAGFDVQFGIQQRYIISAESQLLYVVNGSYGINYGSTATPILRYGPEYATVMAGAGVGLFTSFLDSKNFWTHASVKVGYLHPFYTPIWLVGDIEREFMRSRDSYLSISLSPSLGVLLPLRVQGDLFVSQIRLFGGIQLSGAIIFARRTGG